VKTASHLWASNFRGIFVPTRAGGLPPAKRAGAKRPEKGRPQAARIGPRHPYFALFNLQGTSSMQAPHRSLRRERQSSFTSLHLLFLADFVRSEKGTGVAASASLIPFPRPAFQPPAKTSYRSAVPPLPRELSLARRGTGVAALPSRLLFLADFVRSEGPVSSASLPNIPSPIPFVNAFF